MMFNIYKITNTINDKVYIGQTIDSLDVRFTEHSYKSSKCRHLRNAIQKYGKDKFSIELLTICEGQECANTIETFYIAVYDAVKNGYNIIEVVENNPPSQKGKKRSSETKDKMKGNKNSLGATRSAETRKKMSLAKKGKMMSPEAIEKNRQAHLGKIPWNKGKKL